MIETKNNYAMKKLNKFPLILLISALFAFTKGDKSEYSLPRAAYTLFADDIDLDGDIDIFSGHKFNNQTSWGGITIVENNGNGYFSTVDSLYFEYGFPEVNGAKLDNNEFVDLYSVTITTDPYHIFITIIYNYGETQFDSIHSFYIYNEGPLPDITSGDVNGDGYIDLLFAHNNDQFWGVIYNDGTGNFTTPEYFDLDFPPSEIKCKDLNEDGRDDIIIAAHRIVVFYSTESGFEEQLLGYTLPWSLGGHTLGVADFDQDGDNDILYYATHIDDVGVLYMYENLGNNEFMERPHFEFSPFCSYFQIADFDNNSFPDIVFIDLDDSGFHIYKNKGNFQLEFDQFIPNSGGLQFLEHLACTDLDLNGFNDIAYVIYNHDYIPYNLVCLFNDGQGNFVNDPIISTNEISHFKELPIISYPNPFKYETTIKFKIKEKSNVELSVYNLSGKLIQVLINKNMKGGTHSIKWSGTDMTGQACSPGSYIACLKANKAVLHCFKLIKY